MIAVVKMQHDLAVALTRIKAKLAKFKHSAVTQDKHELRPLKGICRWKWRPVHKMITGSIQTSRPATAHPMNSN
jgi:hypothetical protein